MKEIAPALVTYKTFEKFNLESLFFGTEDYAVEISDWIKYEAKKKLKSKNFKLFAYFFGQDVIGISSIENNILPDLRQIFKPGDSFYIPAIGLDQRFQGQPKDSPKEMRFSSQLARHIINYANDSKTTQKEIVLLTHLNNKIAGRFYLSFGFKDIDGLSYKDPSNKLDYKIWIRQI